MSENTLVTLDKGGTLERKVPIENIKIPDAWHIAEALKSRTKIADGPACAKLILDLWHIAHGLHQHIMEAKD